MPLHWTTETSDPGSLEERAGGNSAAQTRDSDKKCEVATPTASALAVQASELHEDMHKRVIAQPPGPCSRLSAASRAGLENTRSFPGAAGDFQQLPGWGWRLPAASRARLETSRSFPGAARDSGLWCSAAHDSIFAARLKWWPVSHHSSFVARES